MWGGSQLRRFRDFPKPVYDPGSFRPDLHKTHRHKPMENQRLGESRRTRFPTPHNGNTPPNPRGKGRSAQIPSIVFQKPQKEGEGEIQDSDGGGQASPPPPGPNEAAPNEGRTCGLVAANASTPLEAGGGGARRGLGPPQPRRPPLLRPGSVREPPLPFLCGPKGLSVASDDAAQANGARHPPPPRVSRSLTLFICQREASRLSSPAEQRREEKQPAAAAAAAPTSGEAAVGEEAKRGRSSLTAASQRWGRRHEREGGKERAGPVR